MSTPLTIHVLADTDLFAQVLNAVATFMKQNSFLSLLRLTALIGLIMVAAGYLKRHDPTTFVKWFVAYVLVINLVLLPKTTILMNELSDQNSRIVDGVPTVFAATASLITSVGAGLAREWDSLLSLPDDLKYTKTGVLFGSRLITAAHEFRVKDPQLKEEMNHFFRSCVVGNMRLNHKYSMGDLANTEDLWSIFSKQPSPLRMMDVNGKRITCKEAIPLLKNKLDQEIAKTYNFFGIKLFGKPKDSSYESLFTNFFNNAAPYYKSLTETSSNIFLQSMVINALRDGISNYQAYTGSTGAVINNQYSKSQLQHRWAWTTAGVEATWFLPLLHTILSLILMGILPLIVVLATLPNGTRIIYSYVQIFVSLQMWPPIYAILNSAMTLHGSNHTADLGGFAMVNIERIDEFHADLTAISGYIMGLIPFLAKGIVSSISETFGSLATTISTSLQGTTLSTAGEAAGGTFSLGQGSYYNISANNLAANKHDSNYTNMHGMSTEQSPSGVTKTTTGSGATVYDVTPGMTRGAVGVHYVKALSSNLHRAFEETQQATTTEGQAVQTATSNLAHEAIQFSTLDGKDLRLGEGISETESGQMQKAVGNMVNIASEVGKRMGIGTYKALAGMLGAYANFQGTVDTDKAIWGKVAKWTAGTSFAATIGGKADGSFTWTSRNNSGIDSTEGAKQAQDFHDSFNFVQNFLKNHHFDEAHSQGANLASHMGADLRKTEQATNNFEAAKSRGERIQSAINYVESDGDNINADLSQSFVKFVSDKVGGKEMDRLFRSPGDAQAIQKLQSLGNDFLHDKREALIAAQDKHQGKVDGFYQQGVQEVGQKSANLLNNYQQNKANITSEGQKHDVGLSQEQVDQFKQKVGDNLNILQQSTTTAAHKIHGEYEAKVSETNTKLKKDKAKVSKKVELPSFNNKDKV